MTDNKLFGSKAVQSTKTVSLAGLGETVKGKFGVGVGIRAVAMQSGIIVCRVSACAGLAKAKAYSPNCRLARLMLPFLSVLLPCVLMVYWALGKVVQSFADDARYNKRRLFSEPDIRALSKYPPLVELLPL